MVADIGLKVLSIEDDADTQANLCDLLELDGHRVEAARSVREVLARTNWPELSVVLLDRKLPDGSADALLPVLRRLAPDAAIIIVTGHADLDGTLTALRHGAADYLLKPINGDLLRATLARVAKLREAEERARQAERLAGIGQVMAALAHESGNALARARVCLEMLAMEVEDRPEALELIARTSRAHDDLQRLYEEVRGYAAPLKLAREAWDVGGVWRQAWSDIASARQGRDARLREDTGGVGLVCPVDVFRLGQVFRNLFENSLAAAAGAVRVEVRCAETTLHGQPALRVAVRDDGPGLTAEQRRRAFEPFYTTKAKGTGLGLAIVRRIVEAHGGRIDLGDAEGPGVELVLVLPRGQA
jgi:signal transduction histidine kinase